MLGVPHMSRAARPVDGAQGGSDPRLTRLQGPLDYDDPYVLRTIRDHYLTPPSTEPYDLEKDDNYLDYKVSQIMLFIREENN